MGPDALGGPGFSRPGQLLIPNLMKERPGTCPRVKNHHDCSGVQRSPLTWHHASSVSRDQHAHVEIRKQRLKDFDSEVKHKSIAEPGSMLRSLALSPMLFLPL